MGKIVRQGVEYGGSSNSADCIKYNDTKSVKEAIDEIKASSSSNPTAASVTFNNTNTGLNATNVQDAVTEVNGKLANTYTFLYGNYFAANVTNTVELKDNFQNYKLLLFVCNNGTAQMYAPTVYPASYIKEIYDSTKNTQYFGTYPSIITFAGNTISGTFIPIADNKFKLTTNISGTFIILGLK